MGIQCLDGWQVTLLLTQTLLENIKGNEGEIKRKGLMVLLPQSWLWIERSDTKARAAVSMIREDYGVLMKIIIAGVLIVIVCVIALAIIGFIQTVRAWNEIFR